MKRSSTKLSIKKFNEKKLSLKKFNGDLMKWKTFWDIFESAVQKSPVLTNIDKFSYFAFSNRVGHVQSSGWTNVTMTKQ